MKIKADMYRRYSFNSLLMLIVILACSQEGGSQNHDYIWYYGWANEVEHPDLEGGRISFNENPPQSSPQWRPHNFDIYGHVMADSTGNEVLYYSNGIEIYNKVDDIMENGDSINLGYWWDLNYPDPYISPFSGLSIACPGKENQYLYFHQPVNTFFINEILGVSPYGIYYSLIDVNANDGLGAVVSKNNLITSEYNAGFGLTKTADNSGWWLVAGLHQSNIYHTYLIDSSGVSLHRIDTLGINIYENSEEELVDKPGYSLFSPDGNQFARSDYWNGITILDFDRCEGQLSNAKFHPTEFRNSFTGLSFSPSSRFLYYNTSGQLIQLDTKSTDTAYVLDTIANWDRYFELNIIPFADGFAFSQLARDGKIYISATGSSRHLHVIERPDLPGQACGFRQHGFPLATSNDGTIPHFPNYRLAPIDCD